MTVKLSMAMVIARVDERDGQRCVRCGVWIQGGSRHHRKSRKHPGSDVPENLILLCGSGTTGCHGWVHGHPEAAREAGWIVPSWAEPAEVPMMWFDQRVMLTRDGGVEVLES